MSAIDVQLILAASAITIFVCLLNFKELKLLCFDEGFAGSRGYPVVMLDVLLMSMVVLITIVGLQAVGLILIIALMVIPAAAARFWTDTLWKMTAYSVALGTAGCVIGAIVSAVFPKLPSGAMIVLVCALFFFLSMLLGTSRGILSRFIRRRRLNRRVQRQHLLRAMYERIEHPDSAKSSSSAPLDRKSKIPLDELLSMRSWTRKTLLNAIKSAQDDHLVRYFSQRLQLTQAGFVEAARLTRQHRLWEMYLITYADVAAGMVDRDADSIEHILAPEIIDQLEDLLEEKELNLPMPLSPHEIASADPGTTTGSQSE